MYRDMGLVRELQLANQHLRSGLKKARNLKGSGYKIKYKSVFITSLIQATSLVGWLYRRSVLDQGSVKNCPWLRE